MNLITDAMAQTEQPAAPPAETAPAPAAPTPPTPAPPAPAPAASAPGPQTAQTQTGVGANTASDQNQPPSLPDLFAQLIPIFVVMGIVYILVIRPRARREKAALDALRNVRRGDTVVTTGGIVGKVTKAIDDNEIELEIAQNARIRLVRSAVAEVRAKGEPVKEAPAPAPAKPAVEPKTPAKAVKPAPETKAKS
jgi:preprotein translocase subunit YajC